MFSPKIWNKARIPLSPLQHYAGSSHQYNGQENKIKIKYTENIEIKLSKFAEGKVIYIENPKIFTYTKPSTNKWVQQGNSIQEKIQKSNIILYASNEHVEPKIKNTIPITIVQKIK